MSEPTNRVAVDFRRGALALHVDLDWEERVAVVFGRSGAGKSTLFEVLLGLHPVPDARIRLGGEWLAEASQALPPWQRGLGWVPQEPSLFPHLSVERNLRFGAERAGGDTAAIERAVEVLELGPLLARRPGDLSGGERQRVAIGRAIASAPRVLLLDEPLASVDLALRGRVLRYLLRVRDELDLPLLAITHEPDEALVLAERVIVLDAGRVVATGAPAEVLWSRAVLPLSESLGLENVFEGRAASPGATSIFVSEGGLELVLPFDLPPDLPACIGLRASEVLIAADPPGRISARNVFEARVERCEPTSDGVFVHLVAGRDERLVAKLTADAAANLGLAPDARVHAVIKAQALRRLA